MTTNQRPSEEKEEELEEMEPIDVEESSDSSGPSSTASSEDAERNGGTSSSVEQAPAEEKEEEQAPEVEPVAEEETSAEETPEPEAPAEETPEAEPETEPADDPPEEEAPAEETTPEPETEQETPEAEPEADVGAPEEPPSSELPPEDSDKPETPEPETEPVAETEPTAEEPETPAEPEVVEETVVPEATEPVAEETTPPEEPAESAPAENTTTPAQLGDRRSPDFVDGSSASFEIEATTPTDVGEPAVETTPEPITETPKPKPKKKKRSILVEEEKIVLDHDPKEELQKDTKGNKMREVFIEKIVVNIGVGEAGDKLQRAEKVLKLLTGQASTRTLSRTTNRDFGVRKLMPIGCKVTLRRDDAVKFLKEAFWVKENRVAGYSFDREGNFSFGIPDYTSFPDQKYDPDIGIFGMDICITMARPGKRVGRRKRARARVPTRHRIYPELTKDYLRVNFDVEVVEE